MDEKAVLLNEDDLDGVVGGAINQKVANKFGLPIKEQNGISYVEGTLERGSGKFPNMSAQETTGRITERSLRSALKEDRASFTFTNAAGESVTLNKKQIGKLIS